MRVLALSLLAAVSVTAQAAIYKWVDPATGTVVYSDQPHQNARQLDLPPPQTYSAPPPPPESDTSQSSPAPAPAPAYDTFTFVSPHDQETIQNTGGVVNVSLTVDPGLHSRQGDRISLLMDGQPEYGPTTASSFAMDGVVRGTHSLQAVIKDVAGQVLAKTDTITIFVKQHSRLQPKSTVPP